MSECKFQVYNNSKKGWPIHFFIIAAILACAGLTINSGSRNKHQGEKNNVAAAAAAADDDDDEEEEEEEEEEEDYDDGLNTSDIMVNTNDNASISSIPDNASISSIPDNASISSIPDNASISSIPDNASFSTIPDNASISSIPDNTSTSDIPDNASISSIHDNASFSSIPDNASITSIHDNVSNSSSQDNASIPSILNSARNSFIPDTSSYRCSSHIPANYSIPLIPAYPRHPGTQPFPSITCIPSAERTYHLSNSRNRCLHQQNVDEREAAFIIHKNRCNPFRPKMSTNTNINTFKEKPKPSNRCLHLRNIDEREMAYVNMKNRIMFPRPQPNVRAYKPSEVPLYMRNSVMVEQPPKQKNAPIRCLHMRNM